MGDRLEDAVTVAAWEQALESEYRAFLEETRAAMNAAREGHWIADTEEVVRDAGARFRERALEKLLQLRLQAGEGSFFPSRPEGLAGQGPAVGGAPDGGRPRAGSSAGVVAEGRGNPGAGR